jgi:glutathione S-transferase
MEEVLDLIGANDGDFKAHLDRYKYATRFDGVDPLEHRQAAEVFLARLNQQLESRTFLFGARPCLADMAIAPFIRQFASADRDWFDSTPYPNLQTWLKAFLASKVFTQCMKKHKQWHSGDRPILFPPQQET